MNKKILFLLFLGLILIPSTPVDAIIAASNVNSTSCFGSGFYCDYYYISPLFNFVDYAMIALGIIFLTWGAVKYSTAKDNKSAKEKSKTIITIAVIGLLIAIIAYIGWNYLIIF